MLPASKAFFKCCLAPSVTVTDDPDLGIRLTVNASGEYGVALDREAPSDHVVEHEGSKVLLVGHDVAERLTELTLDTHDTPEGTRLGLVPKE